MHILGFVVLAAAALVVLGGMATVFILQARADDTTDDAGEQYEP